MQRWLMHRLLEGMNEMIRDNTKRSAAEKRKKTDMQASRKSAWWETFAEALRQI